MARRADPDGRRYLVRFGATALLLIAGTLVLVLYVLPERYVLSSGFRESGMSFPTPATPFVPVPVVRVSARPLPEPPPVIPPGPAEIFWADVLALLDQGRYGEAVELFRGYLNEYPTDSDVRREYAVTLLAVGMDDEAIVQLRLLLEEDDDFELRLLLARTLREAGRVPESTEVYAQLVERRPDDEDLWLEFARAYAWSERYVDAAAVLRRGLEHHPDSVALRVELARMEFSRGLPEAAADALEGIGDTELAEAGASDLKAAILAALVVPDVVPPPPPTLFEQAVQAREADDFTRADELFREALRASPDDPDLWQAYADLLEYELSDFEGARAALLEVERLRPDEPALQYRLAQLEIWTGRNPEARARLLSLLAVVQADASADVTEADVLALLGDLERWDGDRVAAAGRYERALDVDPDHRRALDGLEALRFEVARLLVEEEGPRLGASSYGAGDTDEYSQVDLGGEWIEVEDDWAWGGMAGNRWLDGFALDGLPADVQQGVYLDLEAARWWRWGTVRSAAQLGLQHVRGEWDYTLGASLGHRATSGSRTDVRYEHGPAYPLTTTLQTVLAGVVQDHVSVSHARPLSTRWSVSITAAGALLRTNLDTIPGARNDRTTRLQGTAALGRAMSDQLTIGVSTSVMGFTDPGPIVPDASSIDRRLFWDPRLSISTGPFARLRHDLSSTWTLTGSFGPGIAFIDERTSPDWDVVPHLSAEAGVRREGSRFWTALDVFFYQGRFDGYRLYGARLSVSARDWSSLGGAP